MKRGVFRGDGFTAQRRLLDLATGEPLLWDDEVREQARRAAQAEEALRAAEEEELARLRRELEGRLLLMA